MRVEAFHCIGGSCCRSTRYYLHQSKSHILVCYGARAPGLRVEVFTVQAAMNQVTECKLFGMSLVVRNDVFTSE